MITQQNTLELLAEIAVAIAGFAALAGAISDQGGDSTANGFARLRVVVSSGLLLLVSALAPLVVSDFEVSSEAVWRSCSAAALALNAFILYQGLSLSHSADVPLTDRSTLLVFWPTEILCQLCLLAVVFQVFPERSGSLYLLFLYSALIQTSWIFLEFLDATFSSDRSMNRKVDR